MQWQIQDFEKAGRNFVRGADLLRGAGEGADSEGSYYQSRSDCTRPQAVMGRVREGVAPSRLGHPGMLAPKNFLICECPYVHFRVLKGHIF